MIVLMFKPRFAPLVQSGAKRQTIRPLRKRPIKPGDVLSLREWTGLPYRSPQRILRDGETCIATEEFRIVENPFAPGAFKALLCGMNMELDDREILAMADGFKNWNEMFLWFLATHGLPFKGTLIKW